MLSASSDTFHRPARKAICLPHRTESHQSCKQQNFFRFGQSSGFTGISHVINYIHRLIDTLCHASAREKLKFIKKKDDTAMKNTFGILFGILLLGAAAFAQSD